MILSFVDRDMVMRYFGGGIGHLCNSTRHQVDAEPPDTELEELEEEMEISDNGGNNASGPDEAPEDIIMNYNSEVENSDDEQGSGSNSSESDSDEDSDSDEGSGEDSDDDSDDDGYGSF
jgi:hypothetical protein